MPQAPRAPHASAPPSVRPFAALRLPPFRLSARPPTCEGALQPPPAAGPRLPPRPQLPARGLHALRHLAHRQHHAADGLHGHPGDALGTGGETGVLWKPKSGKVMGRRKGRGGCGLGGTCVGSRQLLAGQCELWRSRLAPQRVPGLPGPTLATPPRKPPRPPSAPPSKGLVTMPRAPDMSPLAKALPPSTTPPPRLRTWGRRRGALFTAMQARRHTRSVGRLIDDKVDNSNPARQRLRG